MKKILTIAIIVLSILFTACGSKIPFVKQDPLKNSALVYIYFPVNVGESESDSISDYTIRFNGKNIMERISSGEYMAFNLKPGNIAVSVVKKQIQEKEISLNFKANQIYYLKIMDNLDNGTFDFVRVNKRVAYKELLKTGLAGSSVEDEVSITNVFADTPKEKAVLAEPTVQTISKISKMDEIQKAYEMKEKGILSETEFNSLKAEILAK